MCTLFTSASSATPQILLCWRNPCRTVATLSAWRWQSKALATQLDLIPQSTYLPEYHGVCPSSQLGPPTPSPASECVPPRSQSGRGHTPAGQGMGKSQFWRLKNASTPSTLCLIPTFVTLFSLNYIYSLKSAGGKITGEKQLCTYCIFSYIFPAKS